MRGPDAQHWRQAAAEEFDRLFASGTMHAIRAEDQPADRRRDTTYYNPQPKQKVGADGNITYRIRCTIGGDRINYPGATAARTAPMPAVKLLLQAALWLTMDIKDYYLGTPLVRPEFLRIPTHLVPSEVIERHRLQPFIHRDSILFQVDKGMYGLPQAGLLAQQRLVQHLAQHGYHETATRCLFRHKTLPVTFSLVVDDFGVKAGDRAAAQHLEATLKKLYEIKVDWSGEHYLGFHIQFDRATRHVTLSMPGYIAKVLRRFAPRLSKGASTPAVFVAPKYDGTAHLSPATDSTPPLNPADRLALQELVGCLLYYARGVDATILPATTALAAAQAHATVRVQADAHRLLSYCGRYPANGLRLHACAMELIAYTDASYLTRPDGRSVAGGIAFCGSHAAPESSNGAILTHSVVIDSVCASVAEAEYGALFLFARECVEVRQILHDLGYPQAPTRLICDNSCAVGIATDTVSAKRTKSIDMRFHWVRDRIRQGQFAVSWLEGARNLADFFTKPLPVHKHLELLPILVHVPPRVASAFLTRSSQRARPKSSVTQQ
jgi:hypothetical protein